MKSVQPTYGARVVQMVLPLGLVEEWEAFALVRTCVVPINYAKFDAQYPFNRAQIFGRDVVWPTYEFLIVIEISCHCLVIFVPILQRFHCENKPEGEHMNIFP